MPITKIKSFPLIISVIKAIKCLHLVIALNLKTNSSTLWLSC